MGTLVLVLIILGATLMVGNILAFIFFMRRMNDVISSGKRRDNVLMVIGLVLLLFFLLGYLFVGLVLKSDDLVVGLILFLGSIFVTIMLALTNALIKTAKERSLQIAQVLIDVVDAQDPNLHGHSAHVKNLTMMLYDHLPNQMKRGINVFSLEYASLMHDIGKLCIPQSILNKPDKLTDEEWKIMKTHPQNGVKFLSKVPTFETVSDWILYHHERPDGKGYYGKSANEVPFPAKMISVCDTYSAIVQRRSYKKPKTHDEAIMIMKEVAGTQLDKELVEIFVNIPKEEFDDALPEINDSKKD